MRVYYVQSGLQGCWTVRCLLPLVANGWNGDQTSLSLDQTTPEDKSAAAQDADVVVFHRPDDKHKLELARILKGMGKKCVYDNDDTAKHDGGFKFNDYMNMERVKRGMATINETLDSFIKEADLVTCSTEFLRQEYLALNKNVVVLPNCIDPFYFDEPLRNTNGKVRIGFSGSIAITDDINVLEPIVKHYEKDPRVELVLFSLPPNKKDEYTRNLYQHEYEFWENVKVEWHPFVPMEEYYDTLNNLKLDIMIIPRADNYFNRAKSNIKFLEASMFEIPCIAQSFPDHQSPYEVNPKDTENLILATDTEDWISKIEDLIEHKKKRESLGKKANQYVLDTYDIEKNAWKWENAYKSILKN